MGCRTSGELQEGDLEMSSVTFLDHLENPRNVCTLENATTIGTATNPLCGDLLHLHLAIADDKIAAASFKVRGCPPSIAAGSVLTELLTGLTVEEARKLTPADVTHALETLPRNKEHCAILAIDALRSALSALAQ